MPLIVDSHIFSPRSCAGSRSVMDSTGRKWHTICGGTNWRLPASETLLRENMYMVYMINSCVQANDVL